MILSVNIDHIATIRNARNSTYPSLTRAIEIIKNAGAEIVTIHLREDRRHIRDADVFQISSANILPINLEIAATNEMLEIALKIKPKYLCFVPEKREEITTEGGLNLIVMEKVLNKYIPILQESGTEVSLFIEPEIETINIAKNLGVNTIEIHTGKFANFRATEELEKIKIASMHAKKIGLNVHAGHGLTFETAQIISTIKEISTLHIGHFLITESIFIGLHEAVSQMKFVLNSTSKF